MRNATAAKSSNFLQNIVKCQWVHCHWSLRFCSQAWLSAWGSTLDSFPRIILSSWYSARFFRRVGCCWSLGFPNHCVHPQPVLLCCITLSSIRETLLLQLNRPLTCGDDCNIPVHSFFFLLTLLPFSPFPSSSAFYGIYLFSFHLALLQPQWMKVILECEFPLEDLFEVSWVPGLTSFQQKHQLILWNEIWHAFPYSHFTLINIQARILPLLYLLSIEVISGGQGQGKCWPA